MQFDKFLEYAEFVMFLLSIDTMLLRICISQN